MMSILDMRLVMSLPATSMEDGLCVSREGGMGGRCGGSPAGWRQYGCVLSLSTERVGTEWAISLFLCCFSLPVHKLVTWSRIQSLLFPHSWSSYCPPPACGLLRYVVFVLSLLHSLSLQWCDHSSSSSRYPGWFWAKSEDLGTASAETNRDHSA